MVDKRPEVIIDVGMRTMPQQQAVATATEDPFRILVLADFSGRGSRGVCEPGDIGNRRPRAVDRDNFDEVIKALAPTVRLPVADAGAPLELAFGELDDFHPDALYRRVPLFDRLRDLRARLGNPATSAAAIAELAPALAPAKPPQPPAAEPTAAPPPADASGLLESALEATESNRPTVSGRSELVDRLVQDYVAPYAIPRPDARLEDMIADVDRAMAAQMRTLLGAPALQRLEASWRSLYLLVRRLEIDRDLQLQILDVTRDELAAAMAAGGDVLQSGLARQLLDRAGGTAGGVPFAVVVGDFAIGPAVDEVALIDAVATICARAGTAFVAGAAPQWVGCPGFGRAADPVDWTLALDDTVAAAWEALRGRPEATAVGLVMPRFLLRQPYGARSSPVSAFPFEEVAKHGHDHEQLLWGSGAFLVALMLAETWRQQGWAMQRLHGDEVTGIPVHLRQLDGELEAVPGAEVELTSRGAERIGERGIMPLLSVRGTDAVRLGSLRSVAASAAALRGRWGTL